MSHQKLFYNIRDIMNGGLSKAGCVGWISIVIVILVIIVLTYSYFSIEKKYSLHTEDKCITSYYLKYNVLPNKFDTVKKYDADLAKALFIIAWNVELSNCVNLSKFKPPAGFNIVSELIGTAAFKTPRMFGYVLHSPSTKTTIFAFTGTFFLDEWLEDLDVWQTPASGLNNYISGVLVHKGFYEIYLSIRAQLWDAFRKVSSNTENFYITGHSLGGAQSYLATYDFANIKPAPILYTFASPRVFNVIGSENLDMIAQRNNINIQRIANTEDIVPTVPPSSPILDLNVLYQHSGNNIVFTHNTGSVTNNHTTSYLDYYNLKTE